MPIEIGGVEWALFDLLLEHGDRIWDTQELVDEIGSPIAVIKALRVLQAAGLIERTDISVRLAPCVI